MDTKYRIEVSDRNATEFGYGIYIDGIADGIQMASEYMSRDATDVQIASAKRRVRSRTRYALRKWN